MALRVVRLGTPRQPGEGLRLGTARRLPRGVKKADYAKLDWFDLWFPEVAPSQDESRCHRSILKKLLAEHGAQVVTTPG